MSLVIELANSSFRTNGLGITTAGLLSGELCGVSFFLLGVNDSVISIMSS